jgi:hypothetical protein
MVENFRMGALPRVEDLPGFCSASLMVDRDSGRAVVTVTYDSPQDMAASKDGGMAIRQEFNQQMNRSTTEVAEFELVLGHLRVPETV